MKGLLKILLSTGILLGWTATCFIFIYFYAKDNDYIALGFAIYLGYTIHHEIVEGLDHRKETTND